MKKSIKIYTDFDGTISINDVGDKLFQTFGINGWKQAIEDWKAGFISSKECLSRCCAVTPVTPEQFADFADSQQLDPHFNDFIEYCNKHNYPVTVLSDGLDNYITRILAKQGFGDLPVIANHVVFENENRIRPEFPYYGLGCPNCANCKGYHIENSNNNELIVYIGDGLSDRCGVEKSDIVFAKDDLKTFCIENKIDFYEFENFEDILMTLKKLVSN